MKLIETCSNHFVDRNGNIFSNVSGDFVKLKTWFDKKNRYEYIIISENGVRKHFAVHRLVANAYIPNPSKFPEVNHKDSNPHNNCVDNLEWCTRKENLLHSYKTLSPVRNFKKCLLYYDEVLVGCFDGIVPAAKYAASTFGVSKSSLCKYLHSGNAKLVIK